MCFCFYLLSFALSFSTIHADRFIQYHLNSTNSTVVGSTRVSIEHSIGNFNSKPNSNNAIFVPLESANFETLSAHLNASSPIIFLVGDKPVNTVEIEDFLLSGPQKNPIYFAYDTKTVPTSFTHVKTSGYSSNNPIKKTKLQNVIGVVNSSSTFDHEKIAVITAPLDSFSTVPTAKIGVNNNGLALAAFLETMHLISKFPLTNNWAFVFALTDGHFCNFEGLEKSMNHLTREHGSKIKFAVSLESISSPEGINGYFSMKLKRGSAFAKFMECLIDALKTVNIKYNFDVSEEKRTQTVFAKHKIPSIAILNHDEDEISRITDFKPDVKGANAIAWAVSEALLRMMYDADNTAVMIDRNDVDASYLTKILSKFGRVSQFRDQSAAYILSQWMSKFLSISVDEWTSTRCMSLFSSAQAQLILYNPTPISTNIILFVAAFVYAVIVFILIAGPQNIKKRFLSK